MIFLDHGVEYRVYLKPGSDYFDVLAQYIAKYKKNASWGEIITIASTKQTDGRLLKSEYYRQRKETWLDGFEPHSCKLSNIDIKLTDEEKGTLTFIINGLGEQVVDHGWYEVWKYM